MGIGGPSCFRIAVATEWAEAMNGNDAGCVSVQTQKRNAGQLTPGVSRRRVLVGQRLLRENLLLYQATRTFNQEDLGLIACRTHVGHGESMEVALDFVGQAGQQPSNILPATISAYNGSEKTRIEHLRGLGFCSAKLALNLALDKARRV